MSINDLEEGFGSTQEMLKKAKEKNQNSRPPKRICSPSKRLIFKGELLVSRRVSASKGLGFWLRSPKICKFYLVGGISKDIVWQ